MEMSGKPVFAVLLGTNLHLHNFYAAMSIVYIAQIWYLS